MFVCCSDLNEKYIIIKCNEIIGKAIGATPGEYKDLLYEPNVSLYSNGSLYFKKITKEAQGQYLCEAKNNIGAGVSKVIFLKVNGKLNKNMNIGPNFVVICSVFSIFMPCMG